MSRHRAVKADDNQALLTSQLRAHGISVAVIHTVGRGIPDLIIGVSGQTFLVEVKPPNNKRMTPAEEEWHANWDGHVVVATSILEVLEDITPRITNVRDRNRLERIIRVMKGQGTEEERDDVAIEAMLGKFTRVSKE